MSAAIKQNPSFIGEDGDQIDAAFYPSLYSGDNKPRRQAVAIRKGGSNTLWVNPQDVPDLIESLQQVYSQYLEFNEPSADVAE